MIPLLAVGAPAYATDTATAKPKPTPVKPEGHTSRTHKVKWLTAKPVRHGRYLRITWWSGVAPCTVLDRVKVRHTRKKVVVTVYEGARLGSEDVMCVMLAVLKTTTIKLKHPVGHRKIVDGAK